MARSLLPFVQNGYYASRNWIPLVKGNGFTTSGGGEQEKVWETASGSIVTFDAVPAPLRQLSVSAEPVQNLNGYDNPWPAGGGKNKANFPVDASLPYSELITTVFDAGEDITVSNLVLSFFLQNAAFSNGSGAVCDFKKNDGTHQYRVGGLYGIVEGQAYTGQFSHAESNITFRYLNVMMGADYIHFTSGKASIQLELNTSTPTDFSPYSNICPISGFDSVTVNRTGVNVWDEEWESGDLSNGENHKNASRIRSKNYISVKPNTSYYFAKSASSASSYALVLVSFYDSEKHFLPTESVNAWGKATALNRVQTIPSNCYYVRFFITDVSTYANDISINYPSSDHEYHAYNPSSRSISITLGSTVYGGTLDVVNGKMTVDRAMVTLTWNDGYSPTDLGTVTRKGFGLTNTADMAKRAESISDLVPFDSSSWDGDYAHFTVGGSAYKQAFVWLPNGTADTQTITICYPLATPFELTLTPEQISTLQGTNNVWSDAGDVTVEYRAQ